MPEVKQRRGPDVRLGTYDVKLTQGRKALLVRSLCLAAETFRDDANDFARIGNPRLAETLNNQSAEARAMARIVEDGDEVIVLSSGPEEV